MHNKFIILGVVFVILFILLIAILFFPRTIRKNENFDEETNIAVMTVIDQMLRVYYGGFDEEKLANIFSEELLQKVIEESRFRTFREHSGFFRVNRNYMQTLIHTGDNDIGEQFFHVRVRVYEGWLATDHIIHDLIIKMEPDGTSVIIFIEYDR